MNTTDWKEIFQNEGGIWLHDGLPERPHAILTSGLHSDGFVNCTLITQKPALLQRIITAPDGLAPLLPVPRDVDWVIGSAMGAITFAWAVAAAVQAKAGFTEKEGEAMKLARFEVAKGARVLVVEDVISTGGSTLKTIQAIKAAEAEVLPLIVCLVNRSGQASLDGRKIEALLNLKIHSWQEQECPLCHQLNSKPVRPKANWKELTKKY